MIMYDIICTSLIALKTFQTGAIIIVTVVYPRTKRLYVALRNSRRVVFPTDAPFRFTCPSALDGKVYTVVRFHGQNGVSRRERTKQPVKTRVPRVVNRCWSFLEQADPTHRPRRAHKSRTRTCVCTCSSVRSDGGNAATYRMARTRACESDSGVFPTVRCGRFASGGGGEEGRGAAGGSRDAAQSSAARRSGGSRRRPPRESRPAAGRARASRFWPRPPDAGRRAARVHTPCARRSGTGVGDFSARARARTHDTRANLRHAHALRASAPRPRPLQPP